MFRHVRTSVAAAVAARVFVVSYGTYFPPGGGWPTDPICGTDADYIQATFDPLHDMMRAQGNTHDTSYIDIRTPSDDHGVCATKWMEGAYASSPAVPYHANAKGLAHAGATVAAAFRHYR